MTYLMCKENKWATAWSYDFWVVQGKIADAVPMSMTEMLMFVGIVARQSKAHVTFTHGTRMWSWQNGVQIS